MSLALLASAWLVGALGGLHCAAMCGGLLAAVTARDAAGPRPLLSRTALARRQLGYHAGRLSTYALLGAVFGAAGSLTVSAVALLPFQRSLYIAANVVLLCLGASLVIRVPAVHALQRVGVASLAPVLRTFGPILRRDDIYGRAGMGLVWGLMPCAMVYSVLPLALMSGGAWQGAAVMLAFGAGTLPNLIALGAAIDGIRRWLSSRTVRLFGALVLFAFGSVGIHRVLFAGDALAQGPFCLIP